MCQMEMQQCSPTNLSSAGINGQVICHLPATEDKLHFCYTFHLPFFHDDILYGRAIVFHSRISWWVLWTASLLEPHKHERACFPLPSGSSLVLLGPDFWECMEGGLEGRGMLVLHSGWLSDFMKAGFCPSIRPVIGELGNNPALARGEIQGTQLAIPVSVVLKFVARGYPTLVFSVCRELTVVTVLGRDCSCRVRRTDSGWQCYCCTSRGRGWDYPPCRDT